MGFAYKFGNPHGVYFVTTAVVQWVDAFTRYQYCDIVVNYVHPAFPSCPAQSLGHGNSGLQNFYRGDKIIDNGTILNVSQFNSCCAFIF